MHRLLIAAATAVLFTATTSVALAQEPAPSPSQDYPPCTQPGQDHCRVVSGGMGHHHGAMMHGHHHKAAAHHRKHKS